MRTINDTTSEMHGMVVSNLSTDVYLEAANSMDDVGVLLRAYSLVEAAAQRICETLYVDYGRLQHDSLSKHLRALRAIGFQAPVLRMADVVSKHRGPIAHVRTRIITTEHVIELNAQSSGTLTVPSTVLECIRFPTVEGPWTHAKSAPLRLQYLALTTVCAGALDLMAARRIAELK